MSKRIVYTQHDGRVAVCQPSAWCLTWLGNGGFWTGRTPESLEALVESGVTDGRFEWAVRRFIHALHDGGCTTAEAFAIIRDRDCAHLGTGFEVWDVADLPNGWFRDAWVRSHNGGPIGIDLNKARKIQMRRIQKYAAKVGAVLDVFRWRNQVRQTHTPEELFRVWPTGLREPRLRQQMREA